MIYANCYQLLEISPEICDAPENANYSFPDITHISDKISKSFTQLTKAKWCRHILHLLTNYKIKANKINLAKTENDDHKIKIRFTSRYEPRHKKTCFLYRRKQRRRSAAR